MPKSTRIFVMVVLVALSTRPSVMLASCPQQCHCSPSAEIQGDWRVDVTCHVQIGDPRFDQLLDELPLNMTHFEFVVGAKSLSDTKEEVRIYTYQLEWFQELKSLTIRPADMNYSYRMYRLYKAAPWPLCKLKNLQELRLNLFWGISLMPEDISCLHSVRLLDLSHARVTGNDLEWLPAQLAGKSIQVLLLRAFQDITRPEIVQTVNFREGFRMLNATPLGELDLSDNGLHGLAPGLILSLPHLTKLVLSDNYLFNTGDIDLTWSTLMEVVAHPNIEFINISYQRPGDGVQDHIITKDCSLDTLDLFKLLTNRTAYCEAVNLCLLHLTEIVIPCGLIPSLSDMIDLTCNANLKIPIGHLREVYAVGLFPGQYRLNQPYNYVSPGKYCIHPNNSLEVVEMSDYSNLHFEKGDWDDVSFSGVDNLRILMVNDAQITLRTDTPLASFPHLQELHLRGNRVQLQLNTNFFTHSDSLQFLDLSDNEITDIHPMQFANLSALKTLVLSNNFIQTTSFALPTANSSKLELLKLDHNNITVPSREFLADLDRYEDSLSLDLSGNILKCSCQEIYVLEWLQQTNVHLLDRHTYQCQNEDQELHLIASIDIGQFSKECNPPINRTVLSICVSVAVLAGVCLLGLLSYKRRWHIRYRWNQFGRWWRRALYNPFPPDDQDDYLYDGFVSYHSDDKDWVHHALIEEMETKRNLKLFIYMRDMLAGGDLADRVHDAMAECRRIMFVLSPNFLASNFCLYELETTRNRLMAEGIDVFVLVILAELPMAAVPGSMTSLLQMTGYLTWTEDEVGKKLFWDQLEDKLRSPPAKIIRKSRLGNVCC